MIHPILINYHKDQWSYTDHRYLYTGIFRNNYLIRDWWRNVNTKVIVPSWPVVGMGQGHRGTGNQALENKTKTCKFCKSQKRNVCRKKRNMRMLLKLMILLPVNIKVFALLFPQSSMKWTTSPQRREGWPVNTTHGVRKSHSKSATK